MEQRILSLTTTHAEQCRNDMRHILQFTLNAAFRDMQSAIQRNNTILQRELRTILAAGEDGTVDGSDDGDGTNGAFGVNQTLTLTSEMQHAANQSILEASSAGGEEDHTEFNDMHVLKVPIIDTEGTIHSNKKKKKRTRASKSQNEEGNVLKLARKNYSKDDTMRDAVEEWFRIKDTEDAPNSKSQFAILRGINPRTFGKYVVDDPSKRLSIGAKSGKPSIVSADHVEYLLQIVNDDDELTMFDVAEKLIELKPDMKQLQAKNWTHRTFKKIAKDRLGKVVWKKLMGPRKNGASASRHEGDHEQSLFDLESPSVPREHYNENHSCYDEEV